MHKAVLQALFLATQHVVGGCCACDICHDRVLDTPAIKSIKVDISAGLLTALHLPVTVTRDFQQHRILLL